jgi:N-acetylglucosaminyl-diphospho-decaprenol L-rhamnosyltransferase
VTDLSIIIVSWNTCDLTRNCLASVYAYPPKCEFEVCVVDNASADGSAAMIRESFPQARLIENDENVGFARANNQAIRQTTAHYVLLLNSDTRAHPGALEALVTFMNEHPEAGAAGAHILNPDGTLQMSCYPAPTVSRELWRLLHLDTLRPYGEYRMADWSTEHPQEIDSALGAGLILRRKALDGVGLLDENYFMYSEEIDLCYRLKKSGWHIYWVPQARIIHYGGQSTRQAAVAMFLRLYQGKIIYIRKHYGRLKAILYKLVLLATSLVRLMVSPLALLEQGSKREQHLALAGNYWQLVQSLPRL